jgi:hypothetical protein
MTTKISRAAAEQMAQAIVSHAHKDEVMPLLRQERALFKKLYDMHHPAELRAKMAEVQALLGEGQHTFIKGCTNVYVRSASGYSGRLEMNPRLRVGRAAPWQLAIEECPLALRSFDGDSHRVTGESVAGGGGVPDRATRRWSGRSSESDEQGEPTPCWRSARTRSCKPAGRRCCHWCRSSSPSVGSPRRWPCACPT